MGLPAVYLTAAAVLFAITLSIVAWWIASGRRRQEALIAQARSESDRTLKQAERDAESLRKEAALEAREKAHALAADAERGARDRQQEILTLEQALADKTRALAERIVDRGPPRTGPSCA